LNEKSSGSRSRKQRLTTVGTRCADHVTPLYPQKLALTSPTSGSRSVGIVHMRTKATEFFFNDYLLRLGVPDTRPSAPCGLRETLPTPFYVCYHDVRIEWLRRITAQTVNVSAGIDSVYVQKSSGDSLWQLFSRLGIEAGLLTYEVSALRIGSWHFLTLGSLHYE